MEEKAEILTIEDKKQKKFLRRKVADFDFDKFSKKEIRDLILMMRKTMKDANGMGLSANQIGLNMKVFVAEFNNKFYAIFNPEIIDSSKSTSVMEEGCLSVPNDFGDVVRPNEITVKAFDRNHRRVKMHLWGTIAMIFQHEIDHLNGKLIIDYFKK